MITVFEIWNGGTVQWDRINLPQFVFVFPPSSAELITFFQLSGRMCEVLTQSEWCLNMGGQLFDVPNLPPQEINTIALNIRNTMGYAAVPIPFQIGNPFIGFTTIQLVLWVNVYTGRADMYNPFSGLVYGQQLLPPQQQFNMPVQPPSLRINAAPQETIQNLPMPNTNFAMSVNPQGTVQGSGAKNVLQSIATIVGGVGKIAEFLSQSGMFQNNSQSQW